jgi:hypothetical protein
MRASPGRSLQRGSRIPLWESYEAIRAFIGEDRERAVYYSKEKEFPLELEPEVPHDEYESHQE